jgi:hypothetical protein
VRRFAFLAAWTRYQYRNMPSAAEGGLNKVGTEPVTDHGFHN